VPCRGCYVEAGYCKPLQLRVEQAANVQGRRSDGDRGSTNGNGAGASTEPAESSSTSGAGEALAAGAKLPPKGPPPGAVGSAWGDALGSGWSDPVPGPMPQHPAAHPFPGPWPVVDSRVESFCRQYGVDVSAERVLRQLHPEAQRRVLDEGPVHGANTSLELMNRIHRIEAWEHGFHVSNFMSRAFVNPMAEESFRVLSFEQQRAVMSFGPLMCPDASAELVARVRDVCGHGRDLNPGDTVGYFVVQNAIDASAEAALRSLPRDLQDRVLQEGPVRATKNPSAVLMSRIRRARRATEESKPAMLAISDVPRRSPSPVRAAPEQAGDGESAKAEVERKASKSRSRSRSKSGQKGQDDAAAGPGLGTTVIPSRKPEKQLAEKTEAEGSSN